MSRLIAGPGCQADGGRRQQACTATGIKAMMAQSSGTTHTAVYHSTVLLLGAVLRHPWGPMALMLWLNLVI
jgi:hypothetical protein